MNHYSLFSTLHCYSTPFVDVKICLADLHKHSADIEHMKYSTHVFFVNGILCTTHTDTHVHLQMHTHPHTSFHTGKCLMITLGQCTHMYIHTCTHALHYNKLSLVLLNLFFAMHMHFIPFKLLICMLERH